MAGAIAASEAQQTKDELEFLKVAVRAYLDECDAPVKDVLYKSLLRDRLRKLVQE